MVAGKDREGERVRPAKSFSAGGTYAITHVESKRCYSGQTADLSRRLSYHRSRLAADRHHNRALQRDWNNYGSTAFRFEVVSRFQTEHDFSMRYRAERLLIAANGPALSYNLLSADEQRRDDCGELLLPRVLKLNADQWKAFDEMGGMEWLRKLIERAKGPK